MLLRDRIQEDVKAAMKGREAERLGTLRLLTAAMKQREVDERITLDDAGVIAVIEKMLKQRRDSVAQYEKAGRQDLADVEKREMAVLQAYLAAAAFRGGARGHRRRSGVGRGRRVGFRHGQGDGDREAEGRRSRGHGQGVVAGKGEAGWLNRREAGVPARPREINAHGSRDRTHPNDPAGLHPVAPRARRHRRRDRPARAAQEGRRQLQGLLPFPQREDPFVQREPLEAVLPLLRLRRSRQRDRLRDGVLRAHLSGRHPRARAAGRHGSAGSPRDPLRPTGTGAGQGTRGSNDGSAQLLPRRAQEVARGDRLPQAPRGFGRDRRALRAGLRARGVAIA